MASGRIRDKNAPMTHPVTPLEFSELPEAEMRARAEAFYETMRQRRTVRDFSDRSVPREIIETAILTAGTAPNGANHQPWHFTVLGQGPLRTQLREAAEAEERAFYEARPVRNGWKLWSPWGLTPASRFWKLHLGSSPYSPSVAEDPSRAMTGRIIMSLKASASPAAC